MEDLDLNIVLLAITYTKRCPFLKEKDNKEIIENVQISTSALLNKTNITLKQEMLCVVTMTMICCANNHFHNILRLFDILTNFGFTTSEMMRDYYLRILVYTSCLTSWGTT